MPDQVLIAGLILLGLVLGWLPTYYLMRQRVQAARQSGQQDLATEVAVLQERITSAASLLRQRDATIQDLNFRNDTLRQNGSALEQETARLKTQLQEEVRRSEEKANLLNDSREELRTQFANLANRIFEEKTRTFSDQSKANLDSILAPFKEKIGEFEKKVSEVYMTEGKERHSLIREIQRLQELNQRISEDAENLTKALKGDTKTQGTWGEIILERLLEESGLRKGIEYDSQGGFRDSTGKLLKPDVVVHLPEGKDIIIDSKVSLTAYEKFWRAESEEERNRTVKDHLLSVNSHLKSLETKRYDALPGVRSLDFVLMFIPVEGAFMLTVEQDTELFRKAFDNNIMMVSPSTLLVTLRTIQNIWRYEYQSKNALEIADKAGSLYDKFVGFVTDLEKIGEQIGSLQKTYDSAHNKLSSGRGSLVSRAEGLIELGVKSRKRLPESLARQVDAGHFASDDEQSAEDR